MRGVTDRRHWIVVLFALAAITLGILGIAKWGDTTLEIPGGLIASGLAVLIAHL